jgi:hypothetical protein
MSEIWVLRFYSGNLVGLFDSKEKLIQAGEGVCKNFGIDNYTIDNREHEVRFNLPNLYYLVGDKWQINRALMPSGNVDEQGTWVIL